MSFDCHYAEHEDCIDQAMKAAEEICQKKKVKFTKLRRRVLELIWKEHKPCKAYDLLKDLQKEDSSAKPITIYRALDFLQEHGLVHRVNSLNAYVGCAHPEQTDPTFLLVCSQCNTVEESKGENYRIFFNKVLDDKKFQCTNKTFEIEGSCKHCS